MFVETIRTAPLPAGDAALASGRAAWGEALARAGDAALADRAAAIAATPGGRALLDGIFGCSPFLTGLLAAEPAFACDLFELGPDPLLPQALDALRADCAGPLPQERLMALLRRAKRRAALAVALADLSGAWPLERITGALSEMAETALDLALRHLLREAAALGRVELTHPDDPLRDSGLFVLGMGKLGARELNYSSDIDLIVLYDDERIRTRDRDRLNQVFVRLARSLIQLLQERTADGYVFRTDLRLRPDPASTPLAMSARAAEVYYESMGQNWERAAMIKARTVAGDRAAGAAFLQHLRPFVWRRSLDFEAIRDIHSIKRQINAYRGGGAIAIAGHNIKLGRGGIREIEFYCQTQQLIWGGRDPTLRERATCPALAALARAGHVSPEARDQLGRAYRFLRRLEHRLQMVDDQQTHSLPDAAGLPAVARFMGYAETADFESDLRRELECVEAHYARLFEEEASLGGGGSLVFTGTEDDPDTLRTLAEMGFREPSTVAALVRGWHHGRVRPTRSVRAREILTELMPALLAAFARTPDPDMALRKFDGFLTRLPGGVQLFSLFQSNPTLLDLVAEILGSAPYLADHLSRHPIVLDAVLTADFFAPLPALPTMEAELADALRQAGDFQDRLDVVRQWANDRKFQIGVQMLRGMLDPLDASRALSDVADAVIRALQPAVEREFAAAHGGFGGGGMAVVAFGKLGSRELTFASDLDLVMLYDVPEGRDLSDGRKPLAPATYFMRLTQRLLTAITTLTGEGQLFEVDLRLRPSGSDGPLAIHIAGFEDYERRSAWTWEHMALTRARIVTGPPELRSRIEAVRRAVLTAPRDPDRLLCDIAEMRAKMARAQGAPSPWSMKHRRGGLVDAEFIAQYLILRHAHARPELVSAEAGEVFRRAAEAGLLDPEAAAELAEAVELWRRLQMMLRLTGVGGFDEDSASPALKALLAKLAGCVDFAALKGRIAALSERVYDHFQALIALPAERLGMSSPGENA